MYRHPLKIQTTKIHSLNFPTLCFSGPNLVSNISKLYPSPAPHHPDDVKIVLDADGGVGGRSVLENGDQPVQSMQVNDNDQLHYL